MAALNVSADVQASDGNLTYEQLVAGLKAKRWKRILVLTGAGISVSAGIPDFRSPGTGIYDNLKEYNLPQPEAIFAIDYFKEKPEPFYRFAQNFDLTKFNATPTHYFIKLLQDKGMLFKNMTQNIDNLEQKTGMNMDDVVQCHGANTGASCAKCNRPADEETLQQKIRDQVIMRCDLEDCDGPIKPDITFFGEQLPASFYDAMKRVQVGDLLMVMGTALAVAPFNMIPSMTKAGIPKILFNMNNTADTGGYDFTESGANKLFVEGKCDETLRKLVDDCGWSEEFEAILPECHKQASAAA